MKHWSGLVYLVVGIAIGLIVGASVTGFAAGDDEETARSNAPGRYEIVAIPLAEGGYYVFMLDTRTGRARHEYKSNGGSGSGRWEPF